MTHRLSIVFIWLLAALWLPATMHCDLDTSGVLSHEHASEEAGECCATSGETDRCVMEEDSLYKTQSGPLKVPAPVLAGCLTWVIERPAKVLSEPTVSPEQTETPPELARTWQFTARTALMPGAPSFA